MPEQEESRVVAIRLNKWELELVERSASMDGFTSIGRAVKHVVITHALDVLSGDEERPDQPMEMTLWKISQMADLALGDHDFEVNR